MKAIISTNYDNTYLYFLPITTWCWNKLGLDVMFLMPNKDESVDERFNLICDTVVNNKGNASVYTFNCPKHKEETYTQCSRLYAACINIISDEEQLILGDVDMLNFKMPPINEEGFTIYGYDLVPPKQFPMCYISAKAKYWREAFYLTGKTIQQKLDELLGDIECENMRGNYWSKDQQEAYEKINISQSIQFVPRSNGQNQFALNRIDRTDLHYKDRLNHDVIDAHLWRDGFTDENHAKIMELLKYMHPQEDFTWLQNYRNAYIQLL